MTKVMIIDDSNAMREFLADTMTHDPSIEIIARAQDPYDAWQQLKKSKPEVLTLDIEMPRMDGLTFLAKLMRAKPLPVVMVSDLQQLGAELGLRALQLGAVELVDTHQREIANRARRFRMELVNKVKLAAQANVRAYHTHSAGVGNRVTSTRHGQSFDSDKIIAIGASTGGTEALTEVLTALPSDTPGIVIVQHMPAQFTRSFAQRLDTQCAITVREAYDGAVVKPGVALLAPGDRHTEIRRAGRVYVVRVHDGPHVNRFRPSVDVLFQSFVEHVREDSVGVILTGMGRDGARGLLAMRQAGALTIAQDEATSVVFGMPKEAIALDAAVKISPLHSIASHIVSAACKTACPA